MSPLSQLLPPCLQTMRRRVLPHSRSNTVMDHKVVRIPHNQKLPPVIQLNSLWNMEVCILRQPKPQHHVHPDFLSLCGRGVRGEDGYVQTIKMYRADDSNYSGLGRCCPWLRFRAGCDPRCRSLRERAAVIVSVPEGAGAARGNCARGAIHRVPLFVDKAYMLFEHHGCSITRTGVIVSSLGHTLLLLL